MGWATQITKRKINEPTFEVNDILVQYLDAEGNILNNGLPTTFSEIHLLKHNNLSSVSKNKKRVLDVTNNVLYESVVDAVGKRYQRSLLRKLRDVDECDYHNIHWKLIH